MAKILFDKNNQIDIPTLILKSKYGITYGSVCDFTELVYKKNLNSANELSFTVSKYSNGASTPLWDDLTDLKTVFVPEYEESFQIKAAYKDDTMETKSIIGTSLCEAELSQIKIRNLEINTETDIARDDYIVTKFYNPNHPKASLLNRILNDKAPHYTIGHVDDSLKDLSFEYSVSEEYLYNFLVNTVAEKMQCLFLFDSQHRTIHAYDLCSTCNDCYDEVIGKPSSEWKHYRGDFHGTCPNCGGTNLSEGYGIDTTILIDKENIATSITTESDSDSLKNCFYVEGGDDKINAAFILANPTGSPYLYYFSPEMLAEMPDELSEAILEYETLYKSYSSSNIINADDTTHIYNSDTKKMSPSAYNPSSKDSQFVYAYNNVISAISSLSSDAPYSDYLSCTSPTSFTGQSALVNAYYNAIDLESFIQTKMTPAYGGMEVYDKYHALSLLTSANLGTIAISGFGNGTVKAVVNNAILQMANVIINTGMFSVDICTSSYSNGASSWNGTFTITDLQDSNEATNTITNATYASVASLEGITVTEKIPASITLPINGDYVTYSKNRIAYILSKEDLPKSTNLYSPDTSLAEFSSEIQLHSIDNLNLFYSVLGSCADVLQEEMDRVKDKTTSAYTQMKTYYELYRSKMNAITQLLTPRTTQLNFIIMFEALILAYISEVQKSLDLKVFLTQYAAKHSLSTNLWNVFNYYKREDTYKNDNITSDNLDTNADVLQYAGYLMNFARKELITAATPQISVSSSLNNLLMQKEFEPIVSNFEVGNWINIRTDIQNAKTKDTLYRLRLLSYDIHFDDIQNINVEFSTVTRTWGGIEDVKSVLDSAKTISASYNGVVREVEKSSAVTGTVSNWLNEGLSLTNQKIVNDANYQSLVIDQHGLLARKYDDLSDTFDDCQLKIFNNGLYTTSDNWKTVDNGVGKIVYTDQSTGKTVTDYGIISKTLVCTNGKNSVYINPNDTEKLFKISNTSGDTFYTDNDGNLNVTGKINGCYFNGGEINIGNGNFVVSDSGAITTKSTMSLGNGRLTYDAANGLRLTGNVNATGGTFSGNITSTGIISGGTISGATINGGCINIGNGNFIVNADGQATIKGDIYATQGLYMYLENPFTVATTGSGEFRKIFYFANNDTDIYKHDFCCNEQTIFLNGLQSKEGIFAWDGIFANGQSIFTGSDGTESVTFLAPALFFGNVYICHDITTTDSCDINIGTSTSYFNKIYSRVLNLSGAYTTDRSISTYWADDKSHQVLSVADNGLTSAFGWAGSSDYKTITKLRGQTIQYTNSSGTTTLSDERLKNSFCELDKFDQVYMDLNPVAFRYNNGASERYHFGFKAQNVRDALFAHGYTTKDFAGFVQMQSNREDDDYCGVEDPMGLIYTEFTAWNTRMIQDTIRKVNKKATDDLKRDNKIEQLQEQINQLKIMIEGGK